MHHVNVLYSHTTVLIKVLFESPARKEDWLMFKPEIFNKNPQANLVILYY